MTIITSRQNPQFKELCRLSTGKGIKKTRLALVSGKKLVAEALRQKPRICRLWITAGEEEPPQGVEPCRFSPELFRELDAFGTRSPLLAVSVPEIPAWRPQEGLPSGVSVLVPFQDPENVGAVIRSAVAFGVDHVILLTESAHPFHPKVLRASGGAVLQAQLLHGPALGDLTPDLPLVPLSPEGADITGFRFPRTWGLLPGLEGPGLPEIWRDRAFSIPIRSEVESLNGPVAAAIALYLWSRSS